MRKNGKGAVKTAPLIYSRTHGGGKIAAFGGTGEPPPGGGNSSPVNTGVPAAFGGNFYDGRQFPSLTQVVSLSRTIVTIYPFLPKLSATIRPSAVWKI